jgi:hypothetical protein
MDNLGIRKTASQQCRDTTEPNELNHALKSVDDQKQRVSGKTGTREVGL